MTLILIKILSKTTAQIYQQLHTKNLVLVPILWNKKTLKITIIWTVHHNLIIQLTIPNKKNQYLLFIASRIQVPEKTYLNFQYPLFLHPKKNRKK